MCNTTQVFSLDEALRKNNPFGKGKTWCYFMHSNERLLLQSVGTGNQTHTHFRPKSSLGRQKQQMGIKVYKKDKYINGFIALEMKVSKEAACEPRAMH